MYKRKVFIQPLQSIELQKMKSFCSLKSKCADSSETCKGCRKFSCVCGEKIRPSKFVLRSQLSPNNFRRDFFDHGQQKRFFFPGISTPELVKSRIYTPYMNSKKAIRIQKMELGSNASSTEIKSKKIGVNPRFRLNFENEQKLREKIVNVGVKYLQDPDARYKKKKLIELMYNLIRKGDRGDYACSNRKKLEEIAEFIIRHNSELAFEKFIFHDGEAEKVLVSRFHAFLKAFSTSIIV